MQTKSTILIVDDEPTGRQLLEDLLMPQGYDLVFACNGAEALAKAAEAPPDLILLDVMMPEMDGFSVLRALRARPEGAAVPVVFLTARTPDGDEYRKSGADGVIAKPFDPHGLVERVRAYTGEYARA
jgi:CheY-like chemotaxis protein